MRDLEKVGGIDKLKLNGEHYLQSLLEQAYVLGMLSDSEIQRIQLDCFELLAKESKRSNGGSSTSIRVEVAESLFVSILFTIGFHLKTFPCPEDALECIRKDCIEEIFHRGRKQIAEVVKKAKLFHLLMLPNIMSIKNEFYYSTVVEGIKGFFKLYDSDFHAQEIHITVDYPAYNAIKELTGIEFIQEYLNHLHYENLFCSNFKTVDIHKLLKGFDEKYELLLLNIYEPILAVALGLTIVGEEVKKLTLTKANQRSLYSIFAGKEADEIEEILAKSVVCLSVKMELSEGLTRYIEDSLPKLAKEIKHGVEFDRLNRVFITAKP